MNKNKTNCGLQNKNYANKLGRSSVLILVFSFEQLKSCIQQG